MSSRETSGVGTVLLIDPKVPSSTKSRDRVSTLTQRSGSSSHPRHEIGGRDPKVASLS